MKNVLLIAPTWVGLHLDIISELQRIGYHVEFIPEYSFKKDPLKVKKGWSVLNHEKAENLKMLYWKEQLGKTRTAFDYLLVIDGQGIHQYLFDELKKRNPPIHCVNYLYDTTYSFYHFEEYFHYYDQVYAFDKRDAALHHINFLPIYWLDKIQNNEKRENYQIFGFGTYSESRYRLFKQIRQIAEETGKSYYIKLHHNLIKNFLIYKVQNQLKKVVGKPYSSITSQLYHSDFITNDFFSTEDYRSYIYSSDVVLDTKVQNQDGLTARFMWALGAGKKIITTNDCVEAYDFYNPCQIYVVKETEFSVAEKQRILQFINNDYCMSEKEREKIVCYRIDNWLSKILTIEFDR